MTSDTPAKAEFYQALCERHGEALQHRFCSAKVAVCGLGGLGSNIAISLARAGVGQIHLIDFDKVDLTNLHRQQYAVKQLGMYKTDALKGTIAAISPYTRLLTDTVRVTEDNLKELLAADSIICEAFDNPQAKAMLVNGVLEAFGDKYIVAGSGMAGIGPANSIRTRRITSRFYLCGDESSDVSESGSLFSSRVMLCAAHQAHTVLRILAGEPDTE